MEDKKIEQFKVLVKKVALSEKEVADLRISISEFVKSKLVREVRAAEVGSHIRQRSWFSPLFTFQPMPIALVIILFVTVGGGVSVAAENALPGDALYPVKVSVNEEVRVLLAVSAESRTEWEIKRLDRRLTEAAKVEAKGEVKEEVRTQIEENFERQADKVEAHIAELEARGNVVAAAQLSSNSEAVLNVHERILAKLSGDTLALGGRADAESATSLMLSAPAESLFPTREKGESEERPKARMKELLLKVRETRDATHSLRTKAEGKVTLESAAEGRLKAAEEKLSEVKKYLENKEDALDAEAKVEAEARLEASAKLIADGKAKMTAGAYKEAFSLFLMAHRRAQEAKLMINSENNLKTGASINISLEEGILEGAVEIKSNGKSEVHSVKDEVIVNPDGSTSSVKVNTNIKVKIGL